MNQLGTPIDEAGVRARPPPARLLPLPCSPLCLTAPPRTHRAWQVQDIIKTLDIDNNGQIEWKEFAGLMADRWLRSEGDTDMALALGLLASSTNAPLQSIDDAEGELIDVDRMRDLLCKHGEAPFSATEWDDFIKLADPGKTGRVQAEAFKNLPCWLPITELPATGNTPRH